MSAVFSRDFRVGWGQLDSNGHMRNTAYLDLAVDARMMHFEAQGFSLRDFERLRVGPVVRRDEIEYFRELRLLETVTVTLALAGLSPDCSCFRLRNEFYRADGVLAARLATQGGWLDLAGRRLTVPPPPLAAALAALGRTDDFETLPSSVG